MDTSAPAIEFDERGRCSFCKNFDENIKPNWHTDERGARELAQMAESIRKRSRSDDFDCIIGLSGGLDSSYTAHLCVNEMGLRPLLFHVDTGWNTDQAVSNIERLVDGLNLDLFTEVINWAEIKDLHRAFFRSQIADQDLPQDFAFFSSLYRFARQHKIRDIVTGSNFSTECCREPEAWGGFIGIDKMLVRDIHGQFGSRPLDTYPMVDILVYKTFYRYVLGMKVNMPLNLVPFVKVDAERLLNEKYGWQAFQHKHHESRFTRFYEDYWLPTKFGFEKRRAHFSSLIMTEQMTRDEALDRISRPEMSEEFLQHEFEYVAHKLDFTVEEFREIHAAPNKTFHDYRNKSAIARTGARVSNLLGIDRRLFQ